MKKNRTQTESGNGAAAKFDLKNELNASPNSAKIAELSARIGTRPKLNAQTGLVAAADGEIGFGLNGFGVAARWWWWRVNERGTVQ